MWLQGSKAGVKGRESWCGWACLPPALGSVSGSSEHCVRPGSSRGRLRHSPLGSGVSQRLSHSAWTHWSHLKVFAWGAFSVLGIVLNPCERQAGQASCSWPRRPPTSMREWELVGKLPSLLTLGDNSEGCPHSPSEPQLSVGATSSSPHPLLVPHFTIFLSLSLTLASRSHFPKKCLVPKSLPQLCF